MKSQAKSKQGVSRLSITDYNCKVSVETQNIKNSQFIIKGENKIKALILPDFKTHYKSTITKACDTNKE